MKDGINGVPRAKFQAVVSFQLPPVNTFAIDEGAVLAAPIDDKEFAVFRTDDGVIA